MESGNKGYWSLSPDVDINALLSKRQRPKRERDDDSAEKQPTPADPSQTTKVAFTTAAGELTWAGLIASAILAQPEKRLELPFAVDDLINRLSNRLKGPCE